MLNYFFMGWGVKAVAALELLIKMQRPSRYLSLNQQQWQQSKRQPHLTLPVNRKVGNFYLSVRTSALVQARLRFQIKR